MESIILVDDEKDLLESLSLLLGREFGAGHIKSTTDPLIARAWIEKERPSVLITDVRMSGLSGLDLLSCASRVWGSIPIVLMTAYASPEIDELVRFGTFKYLSKPFHAQQLIALLKELLSAPRSGFGGKISVSMLADVIQLHALAWSTGALYIDSEDGSGSVWFVKGQIVHAATVGSQGEIAFFELMRWSGGTFSFVADITVPQTIKANNSELLLEAYRLRDEGMRTGTKSPSDEIDLDFDIIPELSIAEPTDNIKECLYLLEGMSGLVGGGLLDSRSGLCLGSINNGIEVERVSQHGIAMMGAMSQAATSISHRATVDEILICLSHQYHLLRPIKSKPEYFFYVVFDRAKTNLAFARLSLHEAEKDLVL